MYLYRAFDGKLFHNGERGICFRPFTQGKYYRLRDLPRVESSAFVVTDIYCG